MPKPTPNLAAAFEQTTSVDRFSMKTLVSVIFRDLVGEPATLAFIDACLTPLDQRTRTCVVAGLVRHCFLIELVNAAITSTKFQVRWTPQLAATDARQQTFDGCWAIFEGLLSDLRIALAVAENRALLDDFAAHGIVPYEIPLDYLERVLNGKIHVVGNLAWRWGDDAREVIALRKVLRSPTHNPFADIFNKVLDKVQVKTYLTDRVQTGDHQTNREKRWECHPLSVHFARRRECWAIEAKLMKGVCHFAGFPPEVFQQLQAKGIVQPESVARCPITLAPLSFAEFEREVRDPAHGEASFQVGHLNPLKAQIGNPNFSHTAANIAWVSADGNRIQGSLTLDETRSLLGRIQRNYAEQGIVLGTPGGSNA